MTNGETILARSVLTTNQKQWMAVIVMRLILYANFFTQRMIIVTVSGHNPDYERIIRQAITQH